ncbi:hypothetical protein L0F63_006936, partial [Massospora cicadina]
AANNETTMFGNIPLKELASEVSVTHMRQQFVKCKEDNEGPGKQSLYSKAMLELVTRVQKMANELITDYKVYQIPAGIGFDKWDYAFSLNFYYLLYRKLDNREENRKIYNEYKNRTYEFYSVALDNLSHELHHTMKRLKQPIPIFVSTPNGVVVSDVGCTSLGILISFVEAIKPLIEARDFSVRTLRDFNAEWDVE